MRRLGWVTRLGLAPVLGAAPSGPAVRRALDLAGPPAMLDRITRARAKARAHAWTLIENTPAGFPWLVIAGKTLAGWVVIDMDATLVTAHTCKEGAAPTCRKAMASIHWRRGARIRVSAWPCCCAPATRTRTPSPITGTCWPPRSGRSPPGSGQDAGPRRRRRSQPRARQAPAVAGVPAPEMLFTCGWMITAADEDAIRKVPADAWKLGGSAASVSAGVGGGT
jgi:hypothetical protein